MYWHFSMKRLPKVPLQNVSELVKQLPVNASLHLVSHSSGGLVGDILSRFCLDDENNAGFSEDEINFLEKESRDADIKNIKAISDAIKSKEYNGTEIYQGGLPCQWYNISI